MLRATEVKLHNKKKGIFRKKGGDYYIQVTRFSEKGAYIRSANAYGASSHPESPHYTDQMELFTKKQYKEMTFDKEKILAEAKWVYHPEVKRP